MAWRTPAHRQNDGMIEPSDHGEDNGEIVSAARDWVVRLASRDLDAHEMRRFKAWLAQSPAHRQAFERERLFWQRLGGLKRAAGPETWDEPAAAPPPPRSAPPPARRVRRGAALAGTLAAACLALFVLLDGGIRTALLADYGTAVGAQETVRLPDGSTAHLNTDTAIAVDYDATERRIDLLRGEVLFEVARDDDRPFRVEAAGGVTEAIGTAFVVHSADGEATVTVTEGVVGVTSPHDASLPLGTVRAAAGHRSRYRQGNAPRPPEPVDIATVALWRKGVILIDDLPLDGALAELDRYRPGRIVLLDTGRTYESVSGAFDVDDIDGAIAGLAATHGLRTTELTDYLLVLR